MKEFSLDCPTNVGRGEKKREQKDQQRATELSLVSVLTIMLI